MVGGVGGAILCSLTGDDMILVTLGAVLVLAFVPFAYVVWRMPK